MTSLVGHLDPGDFRARLLELAAEYESLSSMCHTYAKQGQVQAVPSDDLYIPLERQEPSEGYCMQEREVIHAHLQDHAFSRSLENAWEASLVMPKPSSSLGVSSSDVRIDVPDRALVLPKPSLSVAMSSSDVRIEVADRTLASSHCPSEHLTSPPSAVPTFTGRRHSTHTLATSAAVTAFTVDDRKATWNGFDTLDQGSSFSYDYALQPGLRNLLPRNYARPEGKKKRTEFGRGSFEDDSDQRSCCVISPVCRERMFWDMICTCLVLMEFGLTTFDICFLPPGNLPHGLSTFISSLTAFFMVDIILNFNTGFVSKDETVLQRCQIVKHYLRFWFWVDFVATCPFDLIFTAASRGELNLVRVARAPRIVRTLRWLKLGRSARLIKVLQNNWSKSYHQVVANFNYLLAPFCALLTLVVLAHVQACIWGSLQDWPETKDIDVAITRYHLSFWWAFVTMTGGHTSYVPETSELRFLEIAVCVERMAFFLGVGLYGLFIVMMVGQEAGSASLVQADVLKYMAQHDVDVKTQMQVAYYLQHTRHSRSVQKHFEQVLSMDLPRELQRRLCEELWSKNLMSLELIHLIMTWNQDVSAELSLLVREQVFARKAIVYQEGEPATAAYHLLDGRLEINRTCDSSSDCDDNEVGQEFEAGEWIGEAALINSSLRREGTASSLELLRLLAVDGSEFQAMLQRLGIYDRYVNYLREELWKGFCGRCGTMGHHFTENCTVMKRVKSKSKNKGRSRGGRGGRVIGVPRDLKLVKGRDMVLTGWKTVTGETTHHVIQDTLARDLHLFLKEYDLEVLIPIFRRNGIMSLNDLDSLWGEPAISDWMEEANLAPDKRMLFSRQSMIRFTNKAKKSFRQVLDYGTTRGRHWIFLSHVKAEAGIEASLMRTELEQLISEDSVCEGRLYEVPVFLDLEDLNTLEELQSRVRHSQNIALLLTPSTLLRPWILVEIATAYKASIKILPVQINRADSKLFIPDEEWYTKLRKGKMLDANGEAVITGCGLDLSTVEAGIRRAFTHISLEYSPQRNADIRRAELQKILKKCMQLAPSQPQAQA